MDRGYDDRLCQQLCQMGRYELAALFDGMEATARRDFAEKIFLGVCKSGDDKKAVEAFGIMTAVVYDQVSDSFERSRQIAALTYRLYWIIETGHSDCPVLTALKVEMCRAVAWSWKCEESPDSLQALQFLVAAYGKPYGKKWYAGEQKLFPQDTPDVFKNAVNRYVSPAERSGIEELVIQVTNHFPRGKVLFWLKQPFLPEEFARLLVAAWARNSSVQNIIRVMSLEEKHPLKRS